MSQHRATATTAATTAAVPVTAPSTRPAGNADQRRPPPAPAGSRVLRRGALPGRIWASTGLPWAHTAVFTTVVPLLSVPVLLASMSAAWAVAVAVVLTAVVAWLCLARRVAIGSGWIADRRLLHYRVTPAAQLRSVELVPNSHGGLLRLHASSGRPHRLNLHEFGSPHARSALSTLLTVGTPTVGAGVLSALRPAVAAGPAVTGTAP